jgi:hypothetical protein
MKSGVKGIIGTALPSNFRFPIWLGFLGGGRKGHAVESLAEPLQTEAVKYKLSVGSEVKRELLGNGLLGTLNAMSAKSIRYQDLVDRYAKRAATVVS